jgi:opacity protein-like surface antigen
MRTLIATCALVLLLAAAAARADEIDPTRFEQGIGFAAGAISGSGLSYIYHSDGPLSYQFTGGLWKNRDDLSYDAGFLLRRSVHETRNTRLYLAAGLALYEERTKDAAVDKTTVDTHWNTGAGLGLQFFVWGCVGVSLDGDFTFFLNDDKIWFMPQAAFQYHF